ncbi:uncharacterized protein LOC128164662 isoform X4 [Crassostrea angulata]|uniref:uncharacterized protein LOC128164662 isoform X4 n=1 Tax=Magallana angulata TaxID=2784310 RepID=UPI0022B1C490|nr:uncharacterized protein LOC128164662 isoform X4 [Crassostrea angulata]
MEVVSRCLCTLFLVLTLVCESVTGLICSGIRYGYYYYCGFWFIWIVFFALIACCIIAMRRRRRNRLQYIRVAQPAYGTTSTSYPTPPPAGAYQYPQPAPSAPVNPPQYAQPQKPPPYQ